MKRGGLPVLALISLLSTDVAAAQSKNTSEIRGTITDPSGAVVPGAKITVTSTGTGAVKETLANDRGEYRVVLLPPGTYDVRAENTGFVTQTRKGIAVTVGQTTVIDVQLAVGATTELVEVSGEAPLVETERSQQANTIDELAVRNLPINRRDYLTFALLAPGIADSKALADANSFRVKQTPDSGISFYGSNGRGNSVTVDGGEANDAGGGVRPTVSQEAVQEFQINRTNYSAEYGGARGGVINIVTKSGTNSLRGSLFGFFRHQALDATDPFALVLNPASNTVGRVKPGSTRQQFGGTLGGPISEDRTFFFLAYEQLRRRESAAVPLLTDVSIFRPTPQQEAVLNSLPAAQAAPLRAALTSPPETVSLFQNNSGVFPFQTDDYKGLLRIDHRLNDSNQFTLRYNVTTSFETNQNLKALVGFSRGFITDTLDSTALLGWTHTFSPRVINEARFQYNYHNPFTGTNDPFGPELNINGFGFFNRDIFLPNNTLLRREEIIDNLNIARGSHNLRLGTQVLIRNDNASSATFFSGRFTFGALPGAFVSPALAGVTLNALQAFNLGLAQSYQQGFGDPVVAATYPLYGVFAQDSWKPRPNLTLNLGLRYEVDTRKKPLPTDKNNVAPRFGFAWDPWNDRKTTIRGGYGVYFAQIDYQIDYVVNALNEINGFRQIAQVLTTLNAANPLAVNGPVNIFQTLRKQGLITLPFPTRSITAPDLRQFGINVSQTGPRPPLTVLFGADPNYQNSYTQQASFGIEREVAPGLSVAAGYAWARGLKITRARDTNLLPAPVNPARGIRVWSAPFFKDPLLFQGNIYESSGVSFYNGLAVEANKRFSPNIRFHGNYTFSKAIDDVLDYNSDFQANDQTNLRAERSLSAFDQRHKVVLYGVFQAPDASGGNALAKLARGFGFMPIFRYNSGRPFNTLAGADLNADRHSTTDRPVFAGRNLGRGPDFWTFETRLSRRVRFTEKAGAELMIEAFNLFNRLNFSSVNNTMCAAIATAQCTVDLLRADGLRGRPDRTPSQPLGFTSAFEPRRIQLGVRFTF